MFDGHAGNLRGDGRTTDGVLELGGQRQNRGTDGTMLFGVSFGLEKAYLVFLWKPAPDAPKNWSSLKGAKVEACLWTDPFLERTYDARTGTDAVVKFLDATPQERRRIDGVSELIGKVDVRHFESNIDFVIALDLATAAEPPRKLKGILRMGDGGEAGANAAPVKKAPDPPKGVVLREPIDAVRAYAEGLRDADATKLSALFHTSGKRSEGYVDSFIRWATSSVALERAAAARFGRAGADKVMAALWLPSAGSLGRDLLENLAEAEVEMKEDDRASVGIEPVGLIKLRRVDGQWGMVVPEPPAGGDDQTGMLAAMTSIQEVVAPDVAARKIATVGDAVKAIEQAGEKAAAAAEPPAETEPSPSPSR